MQLIDKTYCGLPWKDGGRSRSGLDCAGLAQLWLTEQMGLNFTVPPTGPEPDAEKLFNPIYKAGALERGDVVFFRVGKSGRVCHVATYLGDNRYLHILKGSVSRMETGTTLMERIGLKVAGAISARDAETLCLALRDKHLGDPIDWVIVALLVISIALSAASAFLLRPKLGQLRNQTGRYGFDSLFTQSTSELPLPDVLGAVTIAGNSPFQSLIDKSQTPTDTTQQKANKVVVLCSGPIEDITANGVVAKINGLQYNNPFFYKANPDRGLYQNPIQDKTNAVSGTIGADLNRPSFTNYFGQHDIAIAHDVRAHFDRGFPVYGFSGSAYMVFRLIDSTKFPSFNLNVTVKGRQFRKFDANGFTVTTVTGESLTGADGSKVRFKLAHWDIKDVSNLTVNGTAYSQISATSQTGNVYQLNKTKGFVEFITAPASSATISITYTCYPRVWSANPAVHLVYLLTEKLRGKGFDESKINWPAADALQDYCDASVTWVNSSGTYTRPRYQCNYILDSKKPIQDHIRAVLDSCYAYLFLGQGKFVMKARKAETSVMDFDESNILADSFSSEKIDRSGRCNRIHVFFHSADTLNAETEIIRDDINDQQSRADRVGDNGIVEETLRVPAVTDQPQAERFGEQILREEVNTRWTCEFKTNIKGLALEPGDVITVTHSSQPAWNQKLFRIEEFTYDDQDRCTLSCSEYFDGAYI
ncbi:phage tail protein [Pedosphaera parvula]|nr:phage tail protein [Pedosphaera parvula]